MSAAGLEPLGLGALGQLGHRGERGAVPPLTRRPRCRALTLRSGPGGAIARRPAAFAGPLAARTIPTRPDRAIPITRAAIAPLASVLAVAATVVGVSAAP